MTPLELDIDYLDLLDLGDWTDDQIRSQFRGVAYQITVLTRLVRGDTEDDGVPNALLDFFEGMLNNMDIEDARFVITMLKNEDLEMVMDLIARGQEGKIDFGDGVTTRPHEAAPAA